MSWEKIKIFFGFEPVYIDGPPAQSQPSVAGSLSLKKESVLSGIRIEAPHIYEDSLTIGGHLRQGIPVIINLKHLEADVGKRLIDFICGTTYAINGTMQKIADDIFLFTPPGISISDTDETKANDTKATANDTALLHALSQI